MSKLEGLLGTKILLCKQVEADLGSEYFFHIVYQDLFLDIYPLKKYSTKSTTNIIHLIPTKPVT